jgi:hypothetical protein
VVYAEESAQAQNIFLANLQPQRTASLRSTSTIRLQAFSGQQRQTTGCSNMNTGCLSAKKSFARFFSRKAGSE